MFTLPFPKSSKLDEKTVINVQNLTKRFGSFTAVDNINFQVREGEIFGFLGPNGAGKTTTIKMLTSILKPNDGAVQISGHDIVKDAINAKKIIGFMPDVPGFYEEMKAEDVLRFYAEFYAISKGKREKKIADLLDMMKLTEFKKKKVKTYSRGMRQKLGLCTALLNDPEILILDEPTIGLDPQAIHFFRKMFTNLNKQGVTIFLSSHILSEVQAICNRVGIINKGAIVAVDSISELSKKVMEKKNRKVFFTVEALSSKAEEAIQQLPGIIQIKVNETRDVLEIEMKPGMDDVPLINETLVGHKVRVKSITVQEVNLEDIFLSLVGET